MTPQSQELLKKHLGYLLPAIIIWGIYIASGITCPILMLSGIPCPTCGVSRALLSLIHLDLISYTHYQPMAIPLILATVLSFHLKSIKRKQPIIIFIILVLTINLIIYAIKLFKFLI